MIKKTVQFLRKKYLWLKIKFNKMNYEQNQKDLQRLVEINIEHLLGTIGIRDAVPFGEIVSFDKGKDECILLTIGQWKLIIFSEVTMTRNVAFIRTNRIIQFDENNYPHPKLHIIEDLKVTIRTDGSHFWDGEPVTNFGKQYLTRLWKYIAEVESHL